MAKKPSPKCTGIQGRIFSSTDAPLNLQIHLQVSLVQATAVANLKTFDSNNENQKPRAKPTSKSSKQQVNERRTWRNERPRTKLLFEGTNGQHSSTRSTHTTPKTQSTVSSEAIFFGASFAFNGKIQPKSTPVKNGMQEVVVILHTLLSSNTEFYSENVDNFEDDPEAERVIHLLESWDRKIFGHPQGRQDSAIVKEAPVSRNGSKTPPSTTSIVTQHEKHGKINI
ncbi:hypothetical protein BDP27DRAFT_1438415 [Rhodocollybia butyracea]|uniref:Uncharacterized protein n=1 Tax=Rhodocollybia butyracea TaxID=206335 RepID=A0A9P5P3F4_9AGAR|nr:hypothetical protein BDP27DRAFT_1438415 [Rhodocollybia butyracea]